MSLPPFDGTGWIEGMPGLPDDGPGVWTLTVKPPLPDDPGTDYLVTVTGAEDAEAVTLYRSDDGVTFTSLSPMVKGPTGRWTMSVIDPPAGETWHQARPEPDDGETVSNTVQFTAYGALVMTLTSTPTDGVVGLNDPITFTLTTDRPVDVRPHLDYWRYGETQEGQQVRAGDMVKEGEVWTLTIPDVGAEVGPNFFPAEAFAELHDHNDHRSNRVPFSINSVPANTLVITEPLDGGTVTQDTVIRGAGGTGGDVNVGDVFLVRLFMDSHEGGLEPVTQELVGLDGTFAFHPSSHFPFAATDGLVVKQGSWTTPKVNVTLAPASDPNEGWTVAELKAFAADHEPPIPIPSSANKAEILGIIVAYLHAHPEGELT